MAQEIKSLKVFLASPGDLGDERKAAKVAVEEINSTLAVPLGFMFQLIGWEDTTSTYGRPQETINKEIKECDIFVGMVWERWGTPPDNNGNYQSGFEEEYELALSLKEKKDKPDISLFLKKINARSKSDPGDQLKKVLKFHEKLKDEKKVLYKEFEETLEFSSLLRRLLADRVHELNQTDREKEQRKSESTQSTKNGSEDHAEKENQPKNTRILPKNSEHFLKRLIEQNDDPNITNITPYDSAKLRLISRTVRTSQNDDSAIGVHDINLLYEIGSEDLSMIENFQLLQDALFFYDSDNAPLWKWHTALTKNTKFDLSRLVSTNQTKTLKEAFKAMRLIGCPITETKDLGRAQYIERVFSIKNENATKGFLEYLSDYGKETDLPLIKNFIDEASFSLKKSAIDCYINIRGKSSREAAISAAIEFEADGTLVEELFDDPHGISDEILKKCIQCQSESLVSKAATELLRRKKINETEAKNLTESKYTEVRYTGILALSQLGELLDRETAESIIGEEEEDTFLDLSSFKKSSSSLKRKYFFYYLRNIEEKHLKTLVEYEPLIHIEHLFIYFERNVKKEINHIRENIDKKFSPEIEKRSASIRDKFGEKNDILKSFVSLHTSQESQITRKLLSILITQNKKEDLPRLRQTLTRADIAITKEDITFLERHGEWEDIKLINKKLITNAMQSIYSEIYYDRKELAESAAHCILKISKNREDELLSIDLENSLMREIVINIADSRLKSLSEESIFSLLNNEDDEVRRFTTCKLCKIYSKRKLEELETQYFDRFKTRYYNVIHWLDFGKSMPKECLRQSLNKVLKREITW